MRIGKYKKETAPMFLPFIQYYERNVHPSISYTRWVKKFSPELMLRNNSNAHDPTFKEVVTFIKRTGINRKLYVPNKYVCRHYASKLHNAAESAGIKCGVVYIKYLNDEISHVLNCFDTRDAGLIFIDVTGSSKKLKCDSSQIARLERGEEICYANLFENRFEKGKHKVDYYCITW